MTSTADRSDQQLADFLTDVSSFGDEATAMAAAVKRAVSAVGAELGALVRGENVVCSVGWSEAGLSRGALLRAASGRSGISPVPGARAGTMLVVGLEDTSLSTLVLARVGADFSPEDEALVGVMARVLSLTLRMLRTLEGERRARERSERQADENARLVASLRERQDLFERLFRIQRSISHRAPINEVLDAITEGAAELLGDDVIGLRLVDPDDPGMVTLVSSRGMNIALSGSITRTPIGDGVGALAITSGELVLTHDYASLVRPLGQLVEAGLQTAMAAPVFQDGAPIGSLVVASFDPRRRYGTVEQEMLLAFAEHASLALNDAGAMEAMRQAFADAVHQSHHDPLTGLANRALVLDRLHRAIAVPGEAEHRVGVLFVDLDRFKEVNDTLGHSIGDEVLIRIGERLLACVRPQDTVGRLAGDEFVVVCEDVDSALLLQIAQRVARAIESPLPLYGRDTVITASIGIARVATGERAEDVLRDADVAMYRAKERGRGRIEVFDAEIRARLLRRVETEQALRRAVQRHELRLHYQPIVGSQDGRLLGVEALVRWEHPERGLIQPSDFIPLAEETQLIIQIGRWVLTEACAQLGNWQADQPQLGHLRMGVNLSARQFADPDIVSITAKALGDAGIAPQQLSLEITESVLMEEAAVTAATLHELKELGVCLSIDDFGTGYSSLSYLKRFPVDALKIDRSFVDGLGADPESQSIVEAVISLAHTLGLEVVGEGVETEIQLHHLQRLGCDAAQGYLIGRPQAPGPGGPALASGLPRQGFSSGGR